MLRGMPADRTVWPRDGVACEDACVIEVAQLERVVVVDKDVLGLQIPM